MQETMKETVSNYTEPTTVHDLRWDWIEDGVLTRQQLAKEVVSNTNGWVVIAYLYRDLNKELGEYKAPRVALVRYRRRGGHFRRTGPAFNLNAPQSFVVSDVLMKWMSGHPDENEGESGAFEAPAEKKPALAEQSAK